MKKIVLVGANHAGTAALNTMLDNYKDIDVTVFDSNSNISFLGCGMALWIGGQIENEQGLFYANQEILEKKGAKIYMETPVTNIDFDNKVVYAKGKNGQEYKKEYDKLILATGSWPIIPKINGINLENIQLVKLYQHAEEVIKKIDNKEIKNITVVGAGYIGVELAEAFKRHNKNVTLVDVQDTCLANYYDKEFSKNMEDVLIKNGVNVRFNETVVEFKGHTKVEKVVTNKGIYDTDMVVLCIGFNANIELGKNKLHLFNNKSYKVNRYQETNIKDVYAVGDCATVYDNSIDNTNYIALATNAVRSGVVAGHNVCGTKLESIGVQGSNGISIWGYNMVSTGITLTKAKKLGLNVLYTDFEDLQKPAFIQHDNYKVKIRIVYDKHKRNILGAQLASYYDMSMGIHMFSLAIQKKVTIDELKLLDIFFLPHFNQPYNYITMAALTAE